MRAPSFLVVVPFLLVPSLVQAQNNTADGVDALIHDDPARAAVIFASLAAPSRAANPVARFFLAVLSEKGFEPQHDPFVPCPLYLSVANSQNPLGAPARAHLQMLGTENPILATCDALPDRASGTAPAPISVPNRTGDRDTHAGVAAFIRGDYQTAANILKPIAERNRRSGVDAVALFFTAAMYQSGIGLPFDPVRACALYMRAGPIYSDSRTWFERLNAAFARDAFTEVRFEDRGLCTLLGTIGFEHRFEPATFVLGAGHSVAFTFSGDGIVAAVSNRGRERPQVIVLPMRDGLVFLPLQYTELAARPPARGSRHFVEFVTWVPAAETSWELDWTLLEIVGGTVEEVARRTLVESTDGNAPNASVDLRSMVVLRNDDAGRAEWAVLGGPEPGREFLPTKTELDEIRAENETREQRRGMASSKPLAFPRPPAFDYVDADGCRNLFVFARSAEGAEVLTIRADSAALRLSPNAPRTFNLSASGPDLEVEVRVSNHAGRDWRLCSDIRVHETGDEEESWRAVSGLLTIQVDPAGVRVSQPERYRASIRLTGVEFVGPTGNRVRIRRPITLAAWVGLFY
jgi:hypothetical protein